jgi:FixJ family two-component response regulator
MNGNKLPNALVYVVDDDAAVRRGIVRLLRASGRVCREFESAKDYLSAVLEPCSAACIVLDIRMPEMSGTELQALVCGTSHEAPIVFVTGHGDIPTCVKTLKAGAVSFLSKPFDESELLTAVAEALKRSAEQRKVRELKEKAQLRFQRLSLREREVFDGVVRGELNKMIAHKMGIAEKTVKVHRGRVMSKMEMSSVADLVRFAERLDRQAASDAGERA